MGDGIAYEKLHTHSEFFQAGLRELQLDISTTAFTTRGMHLKRYCCGTCGDLTFSDVLVPRCSEPCVYATVGATSPCSGVFLPLEAASNVSCESDSGGILLGLLRQGCEIHTVKPSIPILSAFRAFT